MASYRIHFPDGFEEFAPTAPAKGWLDVEVEISGKKHPLAFRDLRHVQREIEEATKAGRVLYTEPGLVVLTEVSEANVRSAVQQLFEAQFFV